MDTIKRLENLISKRSRRVRFSEMDAGKSLKQLRNLLAQDDEAFDTIKQFVPIRLVTIIESFVRHYIAVLIDHNSNYRDRAADLVVKQIKFDYRLVSAVVDRDISLGELIADQVPVSSLGDIGGPFSKILDTDFWLLIAAATADNDETHTPIVRDLDAIKERLARLFNLRHIVVHECTDITPFSVAEAAEYIDSTDTFLFAGEAALRAHLWWKDKHYLAEQRAVACEDEQAANKALDEKAQLFTDDARLLVLFEECQSLWRQFVEAQKNLSMAVYDEEFAELFTAIEMTAYANDRAEFLEELAAYRKSPDL